MSEFRQMTLHPGKSAHPDDLASCRAEATAHAIEIIKSIQSIPVRKETKP